jgi:hypothetical protein
MLRWTFVAFYLGNKTTIDYGGFYLFELKEKNQIKYRIGDEF